MAYHRYREQRHPITASFAYDASRQCTLTISYSSRRGRVVTHYPFPHDELARPQSGQWAACAMAHCSYGWGTTQTTPPTTYFLPYGERRIPPTTLTERGRTT
ncbi:MAG: hypothetical protein KJ063_20870 [Anaerolineae bacterium]|nr:hypothetical protein [Anaerolineae bacterium]